MGLRELINRYWLQDKTEDVRRDIDLPLTNLTNSNYFNIQDGITRIYTVEIYEFDGVDYNLVLTDDGHGGFNQLVSGVLDPLGVNEISYSSNVITLSWDADFLASQTEDFKLIFKVFSSEQEEHIEFKEFMEEVFQEYKTQELDSMLLFYDPERVPIHQIENLAIDHNWTLDRVFSSSDDYLRRQMKFLYSIYKTRRTKDSINFAVSIIRKKVLIYNLLAKSETGENIPINDENIWVVNQETIDKYNDFSTYVTFNAGYLLEVAEESPENAEISEDIFSSVYTEGNQYYPIKHYLLDMNIPALNEDGSLLRPLDLTVLKNYVLKVKSQTQYPHFSSSLYIKSGFDVTYQDGETFLYKLNSAESLFSISGYEKIFSGPSGIESLAILDEGAWLIFPFKLNKGYKLNQGIHLNLIPSNLPQYYTKFKLGTGGHTILNSSITDLDVPVYDSSSPSTGTIEIVSDLDYLYITCTIPEAYANDIKFTEFGLFSDTTFMCFYAKFPSLEKDDFFRTRIRLRLPKKETFNFYNVVFNKNEEDAIGDTPTQQMRENYEYHLRTNGYTYSGGTFSGWSTTTTGDVEYTDGAYYIMGSANVTLYAKWLYNPTYTIYFLPSSIDVVGTMEDQLIIEGVTRPLNLNLFTREGYDFNGWSDGSLTYQDGQDFLMGSGDVNLSALWSTKLYTITFNKNNDLATGSMDPQGIYYLSTSTLNPPTFVNPGFTLSGWSTTPEGSLEYDFDDTYTMGAGDVTLYAIWI